MQDALSRALAGSAEIGSIAVITDPMDERAAGFYRGFGFLPLTVKRLFLPMAEIARLQQIKG
jgi:hypothetical protein